MHCPVCAGPMTGFNTLVFCPRCEAAGVKPVPPQAPWYAWERPGDREVGHVANPVVVTDDPALPTLIAYMTSRSYCGPWVLWRVSPPAKSWPAIDRIWGTSSNVTYLEQLTEFNL